MASRSGIYDEKRKKEVKPRYFVKEARHHPNGFTVYKVICRVPVPHSFDCFKESFIWKRYSDFKDLYKHLTILHRKLFLNGKVPEFAKPKLFGRFEENVVRERQESAENVLNFAVQHPALCKSAPFKEFFFGLQPTDSNSEIRYLKQNPLKPNKNRKKELDDSDDITQEAANEDLTEEDLELFDPFLRTKEFIESTSANQDETWIEQIKQAFPGTTNESQPDDIYEPRQLEPEEEAELLEALKVTVSEDDLHSYHKLKPDIEQTQSDNSKNKPLPSGLMRLQMDLDSLYVDAANAREKHRKSSKASAYLEEVIRKNKLESESAKQNPTSSAGVANNTNAESKSSIEYKNGGTNYLDKPSLGMSQRNSLLDLPKMFRDDSSDDESRGAYLVQASQQISFARAAEAKLSYEEAFGHYKAAINTLLQGVQGDTNDARIRAVKRKTAKYLNRAEEIHSIHLKTTIRSNDLWKPGPADAGSSPKQPGVVFPIDVQRTRRDTSSPIPNCPSPRHKSKDLSNYKVLGTVGKVLLVMDTRDSQSYALKILPKSVQNRQRKGVIPTNVPFMVRLHRYYSTENAICLVIEHAAGGKLWDHLASYFELAKSKKEPDVKKKVHENSKIRGQVLEGGFSSTPKKSNVPETNIKNDKEEDNDCSSSFLDLCMEYKTEDSADSVSQGAKQDEKNDVESQSKCIPGAIESSDVKNFDEKPPLYTASTSSSEHLPIQRSWSYLSWDDGPVLEDPNDMEEDKLTDVITRPNFKKISSQGDIKLFTIDPDENVRSEDIVEDSIYDSRSNDGSDSADEFGGKEDFPHELLSEQDMSAFSLLGDTTDKTLHNQSLLDGLETAGKTSAGSPLLIRVAEASKNSPCLSMNSSFEEEKRKVDGKDLNNTSSTLARVVDENGVSSVDAKTLFRTHSRSRTRSTASVSEIPTMDKIDFVEDNVIEENDEHSVDDAVDGNNIHSIFVGMDAAKRKSLSYRIPESTIRRWSAEIVIAVGTLHSIAILCRDLNPNNILLTESGHIRLSYFGKWKQVERKSCNRLAIKHMYVAPEMSKVSEKKTEACDWWSVGAIVYELMTGKPLHIAHPSGINSHTVLFMPEYLSVEAKSLLNGLLQYYPTQRLGFGIKGLDDLMNHPFFNEIDWDFLIEQLDNS